jgi:LmbE family N-acetylglucosaminyl deacetylase
MKVLIIGAHPDDYELGMGGTIKKHSEQGDEVYSIIMSNGEAIGNADKRVLEAKKSAKFLGIKEISFLNFKDTAISSGIEAIKEIEKIINKYGVDRIYTHTFQDTHQDHRNTCKATLSAGKKVNQILFFESPSSNFNFKPTLFVDITAFLKSKIKALKFYKSLVVLNKRYLEIEAIKSSSSFRGYQSNLNKAESFEVFKFLEK